MWQIDQLISMQNRAKKIMGSHHYALFGYLTKNKLKITRHCMGPLAIYLPLASYKAGKVIGEILAADEP